MLPNYASTINKDRVRKEDEKLIHKEYLRKRKKLSYLGMPSGEMKDIFAWQKYFEKYTAVEIDDTQRNELALNLIRQNLHDKAKILFGDIEEILIKGKDTFNNKLEHPYDVVFLDFFGVIPYKNLRRIRAITTLIEKQKGHSFLLLITCNLKEKKYCTNTVNKTLEVLQKDLCSFYISDDNIQKNVQKAIEWYKADTTNELYRQKLFIPYFIKTISERLGFKTHAYSPIFYSGYNDSPMMHFAFKLTSELASTAITISDQTIVDIINLKVKEASGNRISLMSKQSPCLKI